MSKITIALWFVKVTSAILVWGICLVLLDYFPVRYTEAATYLLTFSFFITLFIITYQCSKEA